MHFVIVNGTDLKTTTKENRRITYQPFTCNTKIIRLHQPTAAVQCIKYPSKLNGKG